LTGRIDAAHPDYQDPEDNVYVLIGTHIIRRAIAIYDSQGDKDVVSFPVIILERNESLSCYLCKQYNSAVTTFDILRNFAHLSPEALQELQDNIDNPSNGFLLAGDSHNGFDRFQWCLQETQVCDLCSSP
jgi:hypothetical protein